jgi:hypothetical protein
MQPGLAAQFGKPQEQTKPKKQICLGQQQDDFDELELEEY